MNISVSAEPQEVSFLKTFQIHKTTGFSEDFKNALVPLYMYFREKDRSYAKSTLLGMPLNDMVKGFESGYFYKEYLNEMVQKPANRRNINMQGVDLLTTLLGIPDSVGDFEKGLSGIAMKVEEFDIDNDNLEARCLILEMIEAFLEEYFPPDGGKIISYCDEIIERVREALDS